MDVTHASEYCYEKPEIINETSNSDELKVNPRLISSNRIDEMFTKGAYIVMALLVLFACSTIVEAIIFIPFSSWIR
ncbi:MAG: hypothetical protein WC734_06275 [Patescibacteria group bacterium]